MNIYDYLNKKNALRSMSDEEFIDFLPKFTKEFYDYGLDNLLNAYNKGLTNINKDWDNLKKKLIKDNNINSTSIVGLNIIKKNMPHIYEVENYKGKSIKNMWIPDIIKKAIRNNRKSHITPYVSEIIRQVGFTAGTSKVTIYRPLLTKRIVEYFNAKNILDICTGWGGRMIGTRCIPGTSYTGIEPCLKTYNGLVDIKKNLNIEDITLYNSPAEDILPKLKKEYDIAITSPPYFNLESYSDEDTQSIKKYTTYDTWVKGFLRPCVKGVLSKLITGGHSCWSVKNFKTDKKYNLLDDIINIHKESGWNLRNDIEFYVGNCIRPGSGKDTRGKEITYVFMGL